MEQHPSLLKEIRTHKTGSFPCAMYRTYFEGKGTLVKHHWHDETEILYFSGGKFRLEINMETFRVESECLCFINSGELHSIAAETTQRHWEDAVVFSPDMLSFDAGDETQMRLIQPLQKGKMLFPRCIMPEHPAFLPVRDAFMNIMRYLMPMTQTDAPAQDSGPAACDLTSQLYIKSSLLYILAVLSENGLFTSTEKNMDKRVESIKTVLTYIRENYREKIYVADLARQANLNEQYFCRLFKKAIGSSPIEYLNEYRIKQTRKLLEETDLPVTEVCMECGYNNLGNFLREFRKQTGTTPLQYRKETSKVKIP